MLLVFLQRAVVFLSGLEQLQKILLILTMARWRLGIQTRSTADIILGSTLIKCINTTIIGSGYVYMVSVLHTILK